MEQVRHESAKPLPSLAEVLQDKLWQPGPKPRSCGVCGKAEKPGERMPDFPRILGEEPNPGAVPDGHEIGVHRQCWDLARGARTIQRRILDIELAIIELAERVDSIRIPSGPMVFG